MGSTPTVTVAQNYGGEVMHVQIEQRALDGTKVQVRIVGFMETNSIKIQHATSLPLLLPASGRFSVRLPPDIIPSFEGPHGAVRYECWILSGEDTMMHRIPLAVENNNLARYASGRLMRLEIGEWENAAYYKAKAHAARLIREKALVAPEELERIDSSFPDPVFSAPCIHTFSARLERKVISYNKQRIAELLLPAPVRRQSQLKLLFHRNVKHTEIVLEERYVEGDVLVDLRVVSSRDIATDGMLERVVDFDMPGHSFDTFLFSYRYYLHVTLDGICSEMELSVAKDGLAYIYNEE